jgi:hypothetical protein
MPLGTHRHGAVPAPLSRAGCSRQFGRASAPMMPQRVHTMRGPNDGTGMSSDHGSARWWHCQQHTSIDRTPLARMLPRIAVVCSCRGGYSRQQCHGKFRPVRATAGHAAGPGREMIGGWHWRGRNETGDVPVPL